MPRPPDGVLERLNYIANFFFDPCDAPFTLYVETMLPALLEAAILWYTPVPDEIFTSWARPSKALGRYRSARKGTRGSKSGRRGPRSLFGRAISFDVNEYIGKRLPGAEFLGRGGINGLNWFLWRIFAFTQLIGLVWLVWEVVSGFWAKWFSLLYETEYCRESSKSIYLGEAFGQLIGNIVDYSPVLVSEVLKQRGPISYANGTMTTLSRNLTVGANITIEGTLPPGAYLEMQIWRGPRESGELLTSSRTIIAGLGTSNVPIRIQVPDEGQYSISMSTNVTLLMVSHAQVYGQAGG